MTGKMWYIRDRSGYSTPWDSWSAQSLTISYRSECIISKTGEICDRCIFFLAPQKPTKATHGGTKMPFITASGIKLTQASSVALLSRVRLNSTGLLCEKSEEFTTNGWFYQRKSWRSKLVQLSITWKFLFLWDRFWFIVISPTFSVRKETDFSHILLIRDSYRQIIANSK